MGFPEAVIAFIVIGLPTLALFGLISRVLAHREKKLELEAQIAVAKTVKNEQLEQRVRVLERIATDKGIDVADEIERLRDERVG
jgi:hypothetical protein